MKKAIKLINIAIAYGILWYTHSIHGLKPSMYSTYKAATKEKKLRVKIII